MPVRRLPVPKRGPLAGARRDRVPNEPIRSQIIAGLIACRKAGLLQGVWVDADVIRVRYAGDMVGLPGRMTWTAAAQFLSEHRSKIGRAGSFLKL